MYCGDNAEKRLWIGVLRRALATLLGVPETDLGMCARAPSGGPRSARTLIHVWPLAASDAALWQKRAASATMSTGTSRCTRATGATGWYAGTARCAIHHTCTHRRASLLVPPGVVGAQRHGKGKHTLPSKTFYQGDWVDDRRTGNGTLTYNTGDKYSGNWLDDKPRAWRWAPVGLARRVAWHGLRLLLREPNCWAGTRRRHGLPDAGGRQRLHWPLQERPQARQGRLRPQDACPALLTPAC